MSIDVERFSVLFATGSLDAQSSGPYLSLHQTARTLQQRGHSVTILGTRDSSLPSTHKEWASFEAIAFRKIGPSSLHWAPAIRGWLRSNGMRFEVASLQSVWLHSNSQVAGWCRDHHVPYVVSVHGNFNHVALQISALKKRRTVCLPSECWWEHIAYMRLPIMNIELSGSLD
jgi:poly(glycerol-phosphate) alpha-glucosyltransferase